ncbi:hypothetical protein Tco_0734322 [Tanacetum coccineum]
MIIAGAGNRPPMLEKSLYDSWKSRMEFYMENKYNGRMILDLVQNGPLVWHIAVQEDVAKEIWDRVKLLMQGTNLSLQEKECKLFDEFDKFSFVKGLAVLVFNQIDDPIACLNKAIAFLIAVASSSYKGNAISSGGNNAGGQARVIKCYNCQDLSIPDGQATQTTIPNIAIFQTEDLDAYDFDYDDVSNSKAVLIANLSNYGSEIILEAAVQDTNLYAQQDSMILSVIEQMSEQMINVVNNWEKANQEKNNESLTAGLERYKERVKTFEQHLNIDLSTREN